MKFLIVDDSKVAKMLLKSLLKDYDEHLEVYEASNGKEGLALHGEIQPDLTFLDLTMPVMDGYTALKLIREKNPQARVIILTSDVQQKARERCLALGACDVVQKLPEKEVIIALIDKILVKKNEC
jgi:two-component system chemotaxis response regulator CheY